MSSIRPARAAVVLCAFAVGSACVASARTASAQSDTPPARLAPRDRGPRDVLVAGATLWATSYATSIVFSVFIGPRYDAIPLAGSFASGAIMIPGCAASASNQCDLHFPFGLARVGLGVAQVIGASMTIFSALALATLPANARAHTAVNHASDALRGWAVFPFVPGDASASIAGGLAVARAF